MKLEEKNKQHEKVNEFNSLIKRQRLSEWIKKKSIIHLYAIYKRLT